MGQMFKVQISPFVRMVMFGVPTNMPMGVIGKMFWFAKTDGIPANYCESTEKKQSGDWKGGD